MESCRTECPNAGMRITVSAKVVAPRIKAHVWTMLDSTDVSAMLAGQIKETNQLEHAM